MFAAGVRDMLDRERATGARARRDTGLIRLCKVNADNLFITLRDGFGGVLKDVGRHMRESYAVWPVATSEGGAEARCAAAAGPI